MNSILTRPYKIISDGAYHYCASNKGNYLGRVVVAPETVNEFVTFYPGKSNYKSLSIDFIKSDILGKGVGKFLIDFVKDLSHKLGCEGRVHVIAGNFGQKTTPPQIFFRKQGFTTANKKHLDIIDQAIKTGDYNCSLGSTPMYLEI